MVYAIRAHSLHLSGTTLVHFVFMILYPLGNVALYGSIYLTLAVSIERFLGKSQLTTYGFVDTCIHSYESNRVTWSQSYDIRIYN
jgi:hypothetical protein